jgi:hypothetical protein
LARESLLLATMDLLVQLAGAPRGYSEMPSRGRAT